SLISLSLAGNSFGSARIALTDFAIIFWVLSVALLPFVIAFSIVKISRKDGAYNNTSWAIIFPMSVFSTTTVVFSKFYVSQALYLFSLIVDLAADFLWFAFTVLLILSARNIHEGNHAG
ncbi:MAG: hypothetical protein QW812_05730, partial [Thermoplasmataceae archaeon]